MTSLFFRAISAASAIAILTFTGSVIASCGVAKAAGTVNIQQQDGSVDAYPHTKIQIIHNTLNLTTADGKGTLIVYRAACAYQGEIMACLPTGLSLIQSGKVNPLDLRSGTIYLNLTDSAQQLSYSTTHLPPHSILLSFRTKRGTYISMSGAIDRTTK